MKCGHSHQLLPVKFPTGGAAFFISPWLHFWELFVFSEKLISSLSTQREVTVAMRFTPAVACRALYSAGSTRPCQTHRAPALIWRAGTAEMWQFEDISLDSRFSCMNVEWKYKLRDPRSKHCSQPWNQGGQIGLTSLSPQQQHALVLSLHGWLSRIWTRLWKLTNQAKAPRQSAPNTVEQAAGDTAGNYHLGTAL